MGWWGPNVEIGESQNADECRMKSYLPIRFATFLLDCICIKTKIKI